MNTESVIATQGTILVVDDDNAFRRALRTTLSGMGFTVVEAARGEEAVSLVKVARIDAVLLDVDIPGMGGVEACRNIRRAAAYLPVLMLTAMDGENEKVLAFEAGADDYITKPFRLWDLTARLRSAVRRMNSHDKNPDMSIRSGQLELDPLRYRVRKDGQAIDLSPREFELLHYLMAHSGMAISSAKLIKAVWGADLGSDSGILRATMGQLRKKIEDDPRNPQQILTVPSVGYRFVDLQHQNRIQ